MIISCYIVDDEAHSINILKAFIEKTPRLALAGFSTDALKALEEITAGHPALTFLDIDMPQLNGLEFAGLVAAQTTIVFTTAFREYALDAFEKAAADYLLKPISYERFLACIQKIRKTPLPPSQPAGKPSRFFVKTGIKGKLVNINIADIIYVTGCDHYIEVQLQKEKVITYITLTEVIQKLSPDDFSRIHKSYIIHHHYLQTVEPGQVVLQGGITLPIGRAYRDAFMDKLKHSMLVSKWDQST